MSASSSSYLGIVADHRRSAEGRPLLRNGLTGADLALATVLLIGAGLLIKSLGNLEHAHLGFFARTDHVSGRTAHRKTSRLHSESHLRYSCHQNQNIGVIHWLGRAYLLTFARNIRAQPLAVVLRLPLRKNQQQHPILQVAQHKKANSNKDSGKLRVHLHHSPWARMSLGIVIFHGLIVSPVQAESHLGEFQLAINPLITQYLWGSFLSAIAGRCPKARGLPKCEQRGKFWVSPLVASLRLEG